MRCPLFTYHFSRIFLFLSDEFKTNQNLCDIPSSPQDQLKV